MSLLTSPVRERKNLIRSSGPATHDGLTRLDVRAQEATASERQRLWPRVTAYRAGHEAYQERTPYPLPLVILHSEEAQSL